MLDVFCLQILRAVRWFVFLHTLDAVPPTKVWMFTPRVFRFIVVQGRLMGAFGLILLLSGFERASVAINARMWENLRVQIWRTENSIAYV